MLIRPATAADIPAMRAIEAQAAAAAHWTGEQYEALLRPEPRRVVLVLEEGGIQGFVVARPIGAEWELENIAVAEAARRRGLGGALLASLAEVVRKQAGGSIYLEVRESNAAARALYQKWGFIETGRRRDYYREPAEDAVVYRLAVPKMENM
ncbi:MAG: ribosomal protein S18-alanine N-acetyltransferase [Terriglobales bacterium]